VDGGRFAILDMMDVSAADQLEILARLMLAAVLGGVMGLERELRGYPAGIRTLALVTMGSTLFTEVSQLMGGDDRVAAQIVTGIGFIGAGLIFREGYTVRGITTAATIWAAAAVGMAIGIELYVVAIAGAALVFLVLEARPFTRRVEEVISTNVPALAQRSNENDDEGDPATDED
jgi:putative Mg2+ transporter-C (MgtC) family protein